MESGFHDSSMKAEASTSNNNNGVSDFKCNICLDLAQDPVLTLCGHLYCWPCLYKWLKFHSLSQQCPVCKSPIQHQKLVPLYGRGNTTTDPRSRLVPGVDIPNRPPGQRPQTAPPPRGPDHNPGVGFMAMGSARFGDIVMSARFSFHFNHGQGLRRDSHYRARVGVLVPIKLLLIIGFFVLAAFFWLLWWLLF